MPDPTTPPAAPSITCWRDIMSALRSPGLRLPVVFGLLVTAEGYTLCFAVAVLVATTLDVWAVEPALVGMFGHVPAPFVVAVATGAVVGGPLVWINVRLMYRAAHRWMDPRTKRTKHAGNGDA